MAIFETALREFNHNKISRLTKSGLSDATIASAINDDLNARQIPLPAPLVAEDITRYKTVSRLAGEYSLISEPKVRALCSEPDPGFQPI